MDTMDREIGQTFDEALFEEPMQKDDNTVILDDYRKPVRKRAPYSTWVVGGEEYKLRLTANVIGKLENAFKRNLLLALTDDGLPPVTDMLFTIQAAMQQYHHGMTSLKVQNLFDQYVDEGGDQSKLMADVIMPLLAVSGFFTQSQEETLTEAMKDLDSGI